MAMPVTATAVTVAAAHMATRVTAVLTTVPTATPVTTAHITGLMDMRPSAAMVTVVTVAAAHTVTCQCGITVAAALTGTLVIIGHGTGAYGYAPIVPCDYVCLPV